MIQTLKHNGEVKFAGSTVMCLVWLRQNACNGYKSMEECLKHEGYSITPMFGQNTCPEITLKYKAGTVEKIKITKSSDSAGFFRKVFDADTLEVYETAIVLFLNNTNQTIGWFKISSGGITGTVIDVRLIVGTALKCGATSIILSHNHPSGSLSPSDQDKFLTKKINEACKVFDIRLLDHVIITADSYYSMADKGDISW